MTAFNIKQKCFFHRGMKLTHLWNFLSASPGWHSSDNIGIRVLLMSYMVSTQNHLMLLRNLRYYRFLLYQNNPYNIYYIFIKDLWRSVMLWRRLWLLDSGCSFYCHSIAADTQIDLLASLLLKSPVKNRVFPLSADQNQVQTMIPMTQRVVLSGAPCRVSWSSVRLQEFLMCSAAAEIMFVCVFSFNRISGVQERNSE